jgi:glutamate--cysteine ligase
LRHPRLAEAATTPSGVLSAYAPEVVDVREHVDLLEEFLDRFTARHPTPGSHAWLPLPSDLTGGGAQRSPSTPPITAPARDRPRLHDLNRLFAVEGIAEAGASVPG